MPSHTQNFIIPFQQQPIFPWLFCNNLSYLFVHKCIQLIDIQMSAFKESSKYWTTPTSSSSINAPLQHPLEQDQFPPELILDGEMGCERLGKELNGVVRRKSMGQEFSIMGYLQRKIADKRGRLYSQTYTKQYYKNE